MEPISKEEQYAQEIYSMLLDGFASDHEQQKWEVTKFDATAWFTGLVMASGMIYNNLTKQDKTFIEYTHLCQNLLIQNMMEKKDVA